MQAPILARSRVRIMYLRSLSWPIRRRSRMRATAGGLPRSRTTVSASHWVWPTVGKKRWIVSVNRSR